MRACIDETNAKVQWTNNREQCLRDTDAPLIGNLLKFFNSFFNFTQ